MTTADDWMRRAAQPNRSWRVVAAFAELPQDERYEVLRRVRAGLQHADADVRALAYRMLLDTGVASWGENEPSVSRHMELELAALAERGVSLTAGEVVPGCGCWRCMGLVPAPRYAPDTGAICCRHCGGYRELVRDDDAAWYQCMECGTRSASAWPVSELGELWGRLPFVMAPARRKRSDKIDKIRARRRDLRPALDVDAARSVPILTVAAMLGLVVNRRGWARCPFHGDEHPSLHVNARKGRAYCNPCGRSWDGIALVRELRGCTLPEAVRELIGRASRIGHQRERILAGVAEMRSAPESCR